MQLAITKAYPSYYFPLKNKMIIYTSDRRKQRFVYKSCKASYSSINLNKSKIISAGRLLDIFIDNDIRIRNPYIVYIMKANQARNFRLQNDILQSLKNNNPKRLEYCNIYISPYAKFNEIWNYNFIDDFILNEFRFSYDGWERCIYYMKKDAAEIISRSIYYNNPCSVSIYRINKIFSGFQINMNNISLITDDYETDFALIPFAGFERSNLRGWIK